MTRHKRTSDALSPLQNDVKKNRVPVMTDDCGSVTISELNEKIMGIASKENPNNRDLIQMIMLTSQRDSMKYEQEIIPKVVQNILNHELTTALSDGGSIATVIAHEVREATSSFVQNMENLQRQVDEMKRQNSSMARPAKWEKILLNERARCIESSSRGLVVFDRAMFAGESGASNDPALEDVVRAITNTEEVVGWKRMTGRTHISKWDREKPPKISIRLSTSAARERVLKRVREEKKFDVKREVPELLFEEFRELSKTAAELREKEGCQTYIGFGGSDIFLRKRKDDTDKWKTVKRL